MFGLFVVFLFRLSYLFSSFLSFVHFGCFFSSHEFSDSSSIYQQRLHVYVSGKKNRTFQNSISQAKLNVMSCDVDMSIMLTTTTVQSEPNCAFTVFKYCSLSLTH